MDLQNDPAFLVFIVAIFGSLLTPILGSDFASAYLEYLSSASYREMMTGKTAFSNNPRKALAAVGMVSVVPIFLGLVGLFYLTGMKDTIAIILALSAGGIFYMLHYDMIPKAHKEKKWLPTFGAVVGFIIGFAIVRTIGGQ